MTNNKKMIVPAILSAMLVSLPAAAEFRVVMNYDFESGKAITGPASSDGGSEAPSGPEATGDSATWDSWTSTNSLGNDYANAMWGNVPAEFPSEYYPVSTVNMFFIGSGSVTSLESLASITNVSSVMALSGIPITDLNGLRGLSQADALDIKNNTQLADITGLSGLTSVRSMDLSGNGSLNSLNGLEAVAGSGTIENLYAIGNALTDISALSSMTSITGDLNLENGTITSISALSGLQTANFISLMNNSIADVSPLNGLDVYNLDVTGNQLTATNDLGTMTVDGAILAYWNNPIDDISGLGNAAPGNLPSRISIDVKTYGTKMDSASYMCQSDGAGGYNYQAIITGPSSEVLSYAQVCN